jgi:hypothetical protein
MPQLKSYLSQINPSPTLPQAQSQPSEAQMTFEMYDAHLGLSH